MKCLVTGSAGFIGSSLVKRLLKEGYEVKALIHDTKPKYYEEKAEYIEGDITNFDSIRTLVKDVDVVFHCAAYVKDYGPKKTFYSINVEGTKNLVNACKDVDIKRFVFLSHIRYESSKKFGLYTETKRLAEQFLFDEYKKNGFPVVIIRPGNAYGPGGSIWVIRILKSIQRGRVTLINHGNGIFLHTYIDNILDALILAIKTPEAVGKDFNITDGDYTISYGKYFNDLAKIAGVKPISKNLSKKSAIIIGRIMLFLNKIFKIKPWITPTAVSILTNEEKIPIEKAKTILGYKPNVSYETGMKKIKEWLQDENII